MTTRRVLELKVYLAVLLAMAGALVLAGPALAHAHVTQPPHDGAGQELANGQNHGPFDASGVTCGGDPAAYGLDLIFPLTFIGLLVPLLREEGQRYGSSPLPELT